MGEWIQRYTQWVGRHPKLSLLILGGISLGFIFTLPFLKIETDVNAFRDPDFAQPYDDLKSRFHEYPVQVLMFEGLHNRGVLHPDLLKHQLKVLQEISRQLPIRTYSLAQAVDQEMRRYVEGKGLLDQEDYHPIGVAFWTLYNKAPWEMERVGRHYVTEDQLLDVLRHVHSASVLMPLLMGGGTVGAGGSEAHTRFNEPYVRASKAVLELKEDAPLAERRRIFARARAIADGMPHPDLKMHHYSFDLMGVDIDKQVMGNLGEMVGVMSAFILVFLFLIFNRPTYIVAPLLIVGAATIWSLGTASLFRVPLSFVHFAAIPIILGTGVDDSILFTQRLIEERESNPGAVIPPILAAMRGMWLALFLSTFTTFVAFLADALTSSLPPLVSFNLMVAVGMLYVLYITITGAAAFYTLFPDHSRRKPLLTGEAGQRQLLRIWRWVQGNSRTIIIGSLVLFGFSLYALKWVKAEFSVNDYLSPTMATYQASEMEKKDFGEYRPMFIELKGPVDDWELLLQAQFLQEDLTEVHETEKIFARANAEIFQDLLELKKIHPSYKLDYNAEAAKLLQDDSLADPVTGLSFHDKAQRLVHLNREGRLDGILIKVWVNSADSRIVEKTLAEAWNKIRHEGLDRVPQVQTQVTGEDVVMVLGLKRFTRSLIYSFVPVSLIIVLILWWYWKNWRAALISMIPIFLVVAMIMGLMGVLHINLTGLTALISALIVGLGVDYPIHMIERYREELVRFEPERAMEEVFVKLGPSIFGCALITSMGFLVVSISLIPITKDYAILSALGLLLVLIACLVLLPIPLVRWGRKLL